MQPDFEQIEWDEATEEACRVVVRTALAEDLGRGGDHTSSALVAPDVPGAAVIVVRRPGVLAGLPAISLVLEEVGGNVGLERNIEDGATADAGTQAATLRGAARSILTAERTILNLLGHLSGVATLTRQYVEAVAGTRAKIYDTRKTLPAWRRLEKYAVRMGGGHNHRLGLFDAILIKDNHLALLEHVDPKRPGSRSTPADAVALARQYVDRLTRESATIRLPIEVEVDDLSNLDEVLSAAPDIVLLDNMSPHELLAAVGRRASIAPQVELEASGGVSLETVRAIAETGVDRISVGALTHSARWLDVALDWV